MTLDGLERMLMQHFPKVKTGGGALVNFVRYADDFLVTGRTKELLEQEVKPRIEEFLRERGLQLSAEKTLVTHIEDGFDFLGQNVRKYQTGKRHKLLITPSKKNVKAFLEKIRAIVKANKGLSAGKLIEKLNPMIRGWANYHRHIISNKTFSSVDAMIYQALNGKEDLTTGVAWKQKEADKHNRRRMMARRTPRPEATHEMTLVPLQERCEECGQLLWVANHGHRTVTCLDGLWKLTLVVRQCIQPGCPRYHKPYRPEEEGRWALPHGECGLEVIALIGQWRFREHRSVPEMHQALQARGIRIAQRSVTYLMQRYEELVTLRITDQERIKARLQKQGHVILALDGLQPDVGHEVLWVVRDCLSEEILLARPLLSSTQGDLTALLKEVKAQLTQLEVAVRGVISDGEETIGSAVAFVFPGVPHQLCQFHYLKDATKLLYEADRHAKTQLKQPLRSVRPIEPAFV